MKPINVLFTTLICDLESAKEFYRQMESQGLLFHPEDSPENVINPEGAYLFNEVESEHVKKRVDETYLFIRDPCEFILHLNDPKTNLNSEFSDADCNFAQCFAMKSKLHDLKSDDVKITSVERYLDTLDMGTFQVTKLADTEVTHSILGDKT